MEDLTISTPIISSCNHTPVYQEVNSTGIMYVRHQRLLDMKRDSRFFLGRLGGTMKKRETEDDFRIMPLRKLPFVFFGLETLQNFQKLI